MGVFLYTQVNSDIRLNLTLQIEFCQQIDFFCCFHKLFGVGLIPPPPPHGTLILIKVPCSNLILASCCRKCELILLLFLNS